MTSLRVAALALGGCLVFAQGPGQVPEALRPAQALARSGKFAEAAEAYRAYLKDNPKSMLAMNGLGNVLDHLGRGAEARKVFEAMGEAVGTPQARAQAQRAMAMSYAFENDCANTARMEEMVYQYWVGVADAYQQGEMLNEAARVCIEAGNFDTAEKLYRRGTEAGLKEANIKPERVALWKFRLVHAEARLAARRGEKDLARKKIDEARAILDGNAEMAKQQEIYFPYLVGYVALYTGDAATAVANLEKANQTDPFIQILLAMAYEKAGQKEKSEASYAKAAQTAGHNPPAAYARYVTRKREK